jgi:hypothetical protein
MSGLSGFGNLTFVPRGRGRNLETSRKETNLIEANKPHNLFHAHADGIGDLIQTNRPHTLVPRARGWNGVEFVASSRQKVGNVLDVNRKAAQTYDTYDTKKRKSRIKSRVK